MHVSRYTYIEKDLPKNYKLIFSGSLEFFSDEFFQAEIQTGNGKPVPSGNFELAEALSLWCFKV